MLKNKIIKVIISLAIISLTIFSNNCVEAVPPNVSRPSISIDGGGGSSSSSIDDPSEEPDDWKPVAGGKEETLLGKVSGILVTINVVGVVVSVISLILLGIKYMLGSVEEKANYKEAMIPYIIGAVLVFSITTIPNMLYQFAQYI